ncbi:hypothetical protein NXS19_002608 [Fusarium pseudograminearum]|nr:hypothetical protein NXS19_002608 [Fusarium pseudograminearum]
MTRSRTRLPRYLSRLFFPKDSFEPPSPTSSRRVSPPIQTSCHRRRSSNLNDLEKGCCPVAASQPRQTAQGVRDFKMNNWDRTPRWFRLFIQLCVNYHRDRDHHQIEGKFAHPEGSRHIN